MSDTKIVQVKYKEQDAQVTIKKLSLGERNQARRESMKITMVMSGRTPQPHATIDPGTLQEGILVKGIIQAPWQVFSINEVRNLPADLADKLYTELEELNGVSEEKKLDSETHSETEQPTQN